MTTDPIIKLAEAIRAKNYPDDLDDEDLAVDWTLTELDQIKACACKGFENALKYALLACSLRLNGYFIDDFSNVSPKLLAHLSKQLHFQTVTDLQEKIKYRTLLEYQKDIAIYLGYRKFDDSIKEWLTAWINQQVSVSLFIEDLIPQAEAFLIGQKVLLPPKKELSRFIKNVYEAAENKVFSKIAQQIPDTLKQQFDHLLQEVVGNTSLFFSFNNTPLKAIAKHLKEYLGKYQELLSYKVDLLVFKNINQNLFDVIVKWVKTYDAWQIKRFHPDKRYALASIYLYEIRKAMIDHAILMHEQFMKSLLRRTKNEFREEKIKRLDEQIELMSIIKEYAKGAAQSAQNSLLAPTTQLETPEKVLGCIERYDEFDHFIKYGSQEILKRKHRNFKRYFPDFLKAFNFKAEKGSEYLLTAIDHLKGFHQEEGALNIPTSLAKRICSCTMYGVPILESFSDSKIPDTQLLEICLAFAIAVALRSGELYIPESKHHHSFWQRLEDEETTDMLDEISTDFPSEFDPLWESLCEEHHKYAKALEDNLQQNDFISITDQGLKVTREGAELISPSVKRLGQLIDAHLMKVRIEMVLFEVDQHCHFTEAFKTISGYAVRSAGYYRTLLAAIIAHATNLGISAMADSIDNVSVDMLQHISKVVLREDTLREANRIIIDYHAALPLSKKMGINYRSSSDAKRIRVQKSSAYTAYYPKFYGGDDQIMSVLTHTSSLRTVFSTQVICCANREALYVIDGLLSNQTTLNIKEHHTDTGGYTEQIFALCFLIGVAFMPRIKNLAKQQIYHVGTAKQYSKIHKIFSGKIKVELIREQWSNLLRVLAALKARTVPAYVIVQRLASSKSRLASALREFGQLIKSIFILRYLQDRTLRQTIQKQLNIGEERHGLADRIAFANAGEYRTGNLEELLNKSSCLSLVSNAVVLWNTLKYDKILKRLDIDQIKYDIADLFYISSLRFWHLISNGKYEFPNHPTGVVSS